MADTLENLQEAQRRRSDETESRPIVETNVNKKLNQNLLTAQGRAMDSRVKIMNKNFDVAYYDKSESIQISQEKRNEDERQSSVTSRPEKRAKTIPDTRESLEDLENGVVNKDIPENLSVDVQNYLHEQIEKQKREAQKNHLQQQSNIEREARDQQNMEQQRDIERKGSDIRSRLDQFYNLKRKKQQEQQDMKSQQQQESTQQQQQKSPPPPLQQQSLVSHFQLYHLVEKLADVVETGTQDQNSDALVTGLSSHFNKGQQLLNSISGSLGSRSMTVDGQKRKLEGSEKLLQQRRELIMEYRKSVKDILKIEP